MVHWDERGGTNAPKASRGLGTCEVPSRVQGQRPGRGPGGEASLCRVTTRPASRGSGAQPALLGRWSCGPVPGRARAQPRAQPAGEPAGPTSVSSSVRPQHASPVACSPQGGGWFSSANTVCSPYHRTAPFCPSPETHHRVQPRRRCLDRLVTASLAYRLFAVAILLRSSRLLASRARCHVLDASSCLLVVLHP